ncbi:MULTISPECIES: cobalt-precorrin 5A hydrolase [Aneurinibacillus]|uniref:Cobalt-precorrin 5A acetaldehyde-lyase n=1 Tax=Aneurinibacillus thermoaerophilus TaxID=143495 RepID=A0A1G8BET4_ANETH|nr:MULTISPECIES: cobalamin biosynthesis protein [Aneurinibacillus]MED0676280.1 cobalamin biosynthesis protein [Aneurinibacillus thermoaerophilus]MED0678671.1 cobalamin biosynthesis protein [Aneurinibacillus thermoaerophilus]MED0736639.1 cobalamin biosynthesis protein [Aneurinibacillus thermoaerophilus]MED0763190.1 cobalamin biosynthesis protein [Aneurinibacillus thermoaerophilus]SDH31594.1 cobalt-precorrin 5A acetaldehyde-lyase [Aneurinibacillus thermoaerophilus]
MSRTETAIIELMEGVVPKIKQTGKYAMVAITKHGVEMARSLKKKFPEADLYYMSKFAHGDEEAAGIQLFNGSVRLLFPALFPAYEGLILFISLGAVVRMIAPVLKDKKTDPGVVVVDDRGQHAISVLSGHLGGANELTREVAALLGAQPVITTASDVQKTIPVDLFGRRFGWRWDPDSEKKLTPVSASVVNEEHVAIIQESGETDWWMHDTPMPPSLKIYDSIEAAIEASPDAALVITHRMLRPEEMPILENGVLYRPKVIALGIGCNRGTAAEEIESVIKDTLNELRFSIWSVKAICTIDLKKDEAGLLSVCDKYGWEFVYYTPQELNEMNIEEPSETVFKFTGAYGVSEPACKRYSGNEKLVLTKKKSGNVTISVGILA